MKTAKRVAKNTGYLYAKMGVTMFISLYTTRLVLNALGASDYGIFNVVGGAIAMMGFLHAAMTGATQRFMSYFEGKRDDEKQKYIFNVSSVLHFVIAILLAIVLSIAGYFFFNGILNIPADRVFAAKIIYGALILSTVFTVISVPYEAVLNAHENMLYYSVVGFGESLLKLTVAIIIFYFVGDKLVLFGVLMAVIPFISRTAMQVYCRRKYSECVIAPRKYWDTSMMKEMTNFAGWSFLGSASSMLSGYGSGIILNHFYGAVLNAANGVSGQISAQLLAFTNTMMKAINPVIVKTEGGGNREEMYVTTFWACKIGVLLYAFFAIPFFLEADFIINLWLKNPPEYAVIFIRIIIIKVLIEQISVPLYTSISAIGNIRTYTIITSTLWFLYLPVLYFLYKNGSPPQALKIMTLIVAFLVTVYRIYFSFKYAEMNLNRFLKTVIGNTLGLVLATAIVAFIAQKGTDALLSNNNWLRLIIVGFVSSFTLLPLFLFTNFNLDQRKLLIKKVKSFL